MDGPWHHVQWDDHCGHIEEVYLKSLVLLGWQDAGFHCVQIFPIFFLNVCGKKKAISKFYYAPGMLTSLQNVTAIPPPFKYRVDLNGFWSIVKVKESSNTRKQFLEDTTGVSQGHVVSVYK